jgi:hypothetical protein
VRSGEIVPQDLELDCFLTLPVTPEQVDHFAIRAHGAVGAPAAHRGDRASDRFAKPQRFQLAPEEELAQGLSGVEEQQLPVSNEAINREPSECQFGTNQRPVLGGGNHHERLARRDAISQEIRNRLAQACVVLVELNGMMTRVSWQFQ